MDWRLEIGDFVAEFLLLICWSATKISQVLLCVLAFTSLLLGAFFGEHEVLGCDGKGKDLDV